MSQVAKSASAFVRAFLAMLVLELEDMVVRLFRPPKLAGVHGDRWTVRLGISVDIRCRPWRLAWRAGICLSPKPAKNGRPVALEGAEAGDRFRLSTITVRFPNQNSSSNHVPLPSVRDYGVCSRHVYGGERYRCAYRTIHNLG